MGRIEDELVQLIDVLKNMVSLIYVPCCDMLATPSRHVVGTML